MKTIYVLSDTHECTSGYTLFIAQTRKTADFYIHLGDYTDDAEQLQQRIEKPVYILRGNGDFHGNYPTEEILEIEQKKILLTHGHRYGVKYGMDKLVYRAMELGVDIVLYGHTHIPDISYEQGIYFICPGSMGYSRNYHGQTYAQIQIDQGKIKPLIFRL